MCKVLDRVENRGIAKGRAEGKAEGIAEGKAEGRAEGKAEGIAEGKAEGRVEGRIETLQNFIRNAKEYGWSGEMLRQTLVQLFKLSDAEAARYLRQAEENRI